MTWRWDRDDRSAEMTTETANRTDVLAARALVAMGDAAGRPVDPRTREIAKLDPFSRAMQQRGSAAKSGYEGFVVGDYDGTTEVKVYDVETRETTAERHNRDAVASYRDFVRRQWDGMVVSPTQRTRGGFEVFEGDQELASNFVKGLSSTDRELLRAELGADAEDSETRSRVE